MPPARPAWPSAMITSSIICEELGRGLVSVDQIRADPHRTAKSAAGGPRSIIVLDALREEMLARNYLASYIFAFDTNLPEERWRDWLNVNDRVVVEAAAIPAESLLVDVPEPTEAELTAFFDEYKDAEPRPDFQWGIELPSPTPAFAVPQKVAVQYPLRRFRTSSSPRSKTRSPTRKSRSITRTTRIRTSFGPNRC